MGSGIDAARGVAPEHADLMDDMKDQLLIVFLKRLLRAEGGALRVPVAEVDATGLYTLSFRVDFEKRDFIFSLGKKQ